MYKKYNSTSSPVAVTSDVVKNTVIGLSVNPVLMTITTISVDPSSTTILLGTNSNCSAIEQTLQYHTALLVWFNLQPKHCIVLHILDHEGTTDKCHHSLFVSSMKMVAFGSVIITLSTGALSTPSVRKNHSSSSSIMKSS